MTQHRRQGTAARRFATATVAAASATVAIPAVAQGAEVVVPNTDYPVNVDGIENVPHIQDVPNVEAFIPSMSANAQPAEASADNFEAASGMQSAVPASDNAAVVDAARSAIGSPYGWGAAGPSAFDCSGLTSWAYGQAGKQIPRTSEAQAAQGTPVSLDALQPGDIIAYYGGASHVGIYTGNGTIIDALNDGVPVQERPIDYMPIHSAVRF